MHTQRGDAGDCSCLHRAPDSFVQQRRADALLLVILVDRQAAEDEHGHRVRPMALDAGWRFGVADGAGSQATPRRGAGSGWPGTFRSSVPRAPSTATRTRTTPYDVAEHLRTPEEMAAYLDAWLEEAPDDASGIAKALGDIARSKGMSQVAREPPS